MLDKLLRWRRYERGQGMVEFALVLPLLLLVMLGLIETGRLLFIYSVVYTSTREAARYGSAAGLLSAGSIYQYQDCSGIRAAAKRVGSFASIEDSNITITYDRITDSGVSLLGSCPVGGSGPALTLGNRVTVQVTVQYQPIVPIPNLPSFPITSISSRTILKNISIQGTPIAEEATLPIVSFTPGGGEDAEGTACTSHEYPVVLSLSDVATENITINYSVSGSATQGEDYSISDSSPIIIPTGQSSATFSITVYCDALSEYDETVSLSIESLINARRGDPYIFEFTIKNDDSDPLVTFATAGQDVQEGPLPVEIIVQLSNASGKEIQVPFTLEGSASPGSDYTSPPAPPLIFPPGTTMKKMVIPLVDDTVYENPEYILVTLGTPINATLGAITAHTVNITDNDSPPQVSFTMDSQTVSEAFGTVLITAHLRDSFDREVVAGMDVSVPFSVSGSATEIADYTISPKPPVQLVIPAGSARADITVTLVNDSVPESDETIIVAMGTPTNATLSSPSTHTVTITNQPLVFFTKASQSGHETAGTVNIEVQLLPAQTRDVTVEFTLSGTATQGQDYTLGKSSPLVIPAGETIVNLPVNLIADPLDELDETVVVTLGTPINAILGSPSVHTLTILDDNPPPTVSFDIPEQSVDESVGNAVVQVQLSAISSLPVTVPLSVSGSATQSVDYTFNQTSVVIPPGSSAVPLTIQIIDDLLGELNETILISMGQPSYAFLGTPGAHTITIMANDQPICEIFDQNPLVFDSDRLGLSWTLRNLGTDMLVLQRLTISWPTGAPNAPKLDKVDFGPNMIYDGNDPHSPQTITSWLGFEFNRQLSSADSTVDLRFTRSLDPGSYDVSLVFRNLTQNPNFDCRAVTRSIVLSTPYP